MASGDGEFAEEHDNEDDDDDNEYHRFGSLDSSDSTLSVLILSQPDYVLPLTCKQKTTPSIDMFDTVSPKALHVHQQQQQQHQPSKMNYASKKTIFHGDVNAFAVEIVAATEEHEKGALAQLLEASFGCFPDRDYCVIGIPSTTPAFPFLRYFVRVTPRPICNFEQELYVLHRNCISCSLEVRSAMRSDLPVIEKLIANIHKQKNCLTDFKKAVGIIDDDDEFDIDDTTEIPSSIEAYVMLSNGTPVGIAVLKEEDDVEYLKTHYDLKNWFDERHNKTGSYGVIQHLTLTPIFQKRSRFFLKELHRLSDFSVLFYRLTPGDTVSIRRRRPLTAVLGDLLFVKPKVKPEFNHVNLEGCEPQPVVHRIDPPFTLHCSTKDTCSLPRNEINAKLVIVGSSETALAFLESLLYCYDNTRQVTFTNVTMIAPHVLNHQKEPNAARDMMFVTTSNLSYSYLQMHQTKTYMSMLNGVLTEIDRKNKKIVLNDGEVLNYDFLFLMCGEQYQKPMRSDRKTYNEYPNNVFIINTETDASHSLHSLHNIMSTSSKSLSNKCIVVYGHNLHAYCCLSALLEFGVPVNYLVFVEPFPPETETIPPHAVSCFNDSDVDAKVQMTMLEIGITVYSNYYFQEWTYNKVIIVLSVSNSEKLLNI